MIDYNSDTFFLDEFGYGTLDDLAEVICERTNLTRRKVNIALAENDPDHLWNTIVGPAIDNLEELCKPKDKK